MSNDDDVRRAQAGQYCWNNWAIEHCQRGTTADVDFSAASLDSISFEGFIFPGRANFSKTVFQRDVSFRGARFQGKARFSEARFHGNARFSCAIFEAPVLLDRIAFSKDAIFRQTNFKRFAYMPHNRFEGYANFQRVHFERRARLTNSRFKGETIFDFARFSDADFNGTDFQSHLVRFREAHFGNLPDFRASKFAVPPNLEGVDIAYVTRDRAPSWRRWLGRAREEGDAPKFRRLKELAHEAKNHEKELKFFADELKAKRFYETKGPAILISLAFEWLSDFGKSVERPAFWLALPTILAGSILSFRYSPMEANAASGVLLLLVVSLLCRLDSGKDDPWASWMMLLGATSFLAVCAPAALTLSLSNSVPFVGGKWSTSCDSMMAFRNKCEFRGWPIVLAGLQSAFSLLLLFLIGLGLRNRFRIGSS
jgi:uncharacterized protein YjbI with pentapeptide repeats